MNEFVLAVIAGVVSGLVVSGLFYLLGGRDLKREALGLRKMSNLITRGLEEAGLVKFNRDEHGEAIGMRFEEHVEAAIGIQVSGSDRLRRGDEDPEGGA